jgi:hypothetical protein
MYASYLKAEVRSTRGHHRVPEVAVKFPSAGVPVENPTKPMREKSAEQLLVRHKEFRRKQVRSNLMPDINVGEVQFEAFILYGFLNSDAKSLIVCIFR